MPSTALYPASIAISWAAASTATTYNVQRTDVTTSTLQGTIYSGSATSTSDNSGPAKGQYQYAVDACNA
ncbi:hypothetical protein WHK03_14460, partial [Staphylococcus aureus]|uniref:hypothetical protein n=1 Tax=Staphylococcus aureus TaxID=1280 RepID=UPI0039BE0372